MPRNPDAEKDNPCLKVKVWHKKRNIAITYTFLYLPGTRAFLQMPEQEQFQS